MTYDTPVLKRSIDRHSYFTLEQSVKYRLIDTGRCSGRRADCRSKDNSFFFQAEDGIRDLRKAQVRGEHAAQRRSGRGFQKLAAGSGRRRVAHKLVGIS